MTFLKRLPNRVYNAGVLTLAFGGIAAMTCLSLQSPASANVEPASIPDIALNTCDRPGRAVGVGFDGDLNAPQFEFVLRYYEDGKSPVTRTTTGNVTDLVRSYCQTGLVPG